MRHFDTSSFRGLWLGWEQAFLTRNRFRATDCSRLLRSLLKSFTKPCSSLAVILPAQVPYSAPPHPHCFKPIRTAGAKRGCNTQTLYGLNPLLLKDLISLSVSNLNFYFSVVYCRTKRVADRCSRLNQLSRGWLLEEIE